MDKKQPVRFSGKELAKKAVNPVVPQDYTELINAYEKFSTEKALLMCYMNDGIREDWFPKEYIYKFENKFYVSNWLLKTKLV